MLTPALLALGVAMLAQLGVFQPTNGLIFDLMVSGVPAEAPRVLVVRAASLDVPVVADRVRAAGATPIIIANSAAQSIPAPRGTISAVQPVRIPGSAQWQLRGPPSSNNAAAFIPAPEQGITRRIRLWLPGETGRLLTVEGAILGATGSAERLVGLPPLALMPSLTSRQIIDGTVPSEALRGHWVVIGPPAAEDPPRFWLSAMSGSAVVGAVDYHARAIQSRVSGRAIETLRGPHRLVLLLTFGLLVAALLAAVRAHRRIALTVGIMVLLLGIGTLMVGFGGIMIPATELLVLAAAVGLAAFRRHVRRQQLNMARLGDRAASYVTRNMLLQDQRKWLDYFAAASRLTGVESSLLLEQQGDGSFHLLAASGPRAQTGAAGMTRSADFDRADTECPVPVDTTTTNGWDHARIARINSGDEGAIYWLLDAPAASDERDAIFAAALRLARRINQYPALNPAKSGSPRRDLEVVRLMKLVETVISRAGDLRRSLRALHTAAMLFDAAGLPIQVNKAMEGLLRRCGLEPARTTPVDVAAALSGLDADAARLLLGDLVRNGGEIRLTSHGEVGGRRFTVRVTEADGDLIFEAIDVTDLHRLAHIQTELAGEIDAKIRNDLEAIELASRLAVDERLPPERRKRALSMIAQATARSRSTLDSMGHLVDASIYDSQLAAYPMNPRSAVLRAVADLARIAEQEGVRIEVSQERLTSLVFAEPDLLDSAVHAMLEIVVRDSPRGTAVSAILHEDPDYSEVVVSGGFGMPADRLAAYLSGNLPATPQSFRTIRRAQQAIEAWGGSLETVSDAGQGFRFALRLRRN